MKALSILYIVALATLLVIPLGDIHIERVEVSGFRGDYIIHCLVYIPWMFLGRVLFLKKFNTIKWFIAGVIFVAVMEFAQYLIPYRGYNNYDLLAGEIGLVISLATFMVLNKFINLRSDRD